MNMETLETLYAAKIKEHDEACLAANPYGCNQYGEGWASEHNGKRSEAGKPVKKNDNKKKTANKNEENKPKFEDYKDNMAESLFDAIERADYLNYSDGVFFDGKKFSTHDDNGGLTIFGPDDIMELKSDLELSGFDSMREAVFSYIDTFGREHFDNIDFNYFKKK